MGTGWSCQLRFQRCMVFENEALRHPLLKTLFLDLNLGTSSLISHVHKFGSPTVLEDLGGVLNPSAPS